MSPEELVPFAGTLSFEQYRRAQRLHLEHNVTRWSVVVPVAVIGLFLVAVNLASQDPSGSSAFVLLFPLVLLLLRWFEERSYRNTWSSHKLAREPIRGRISEHGLAIQGEHTSADIPWDRLLKWKASDDLLLVYEARNAMHVYPRAFFASEEDWQTARELVAGKLSTPNTSTMWRSVNQLLVWIAVFIVLVLLYLAWTGGR